MRLSFSFVFCLFLIFLLHFPLIDATWRSRLRRLSPHSHPANHHNGIFSSSAQSDFEDFSGNNPRRNSLESLPRVAVVGAGMSGLSAASRLVAAGYDVTVFEARNRTGGRIFTARERYNASVGGDIDLGASWIHGASKENPLVGLRDRAGISTVFVPEETSTVFYDKNGKKYPQEYPEEAFGKLEDLGNKQLKKERRWVGQHVSLLDSLKKVDSDNDLDDPGVYFQMVNTEEFDLGAPLGEVSAKYWDSDSLFPGNDEIFPGGYSGILTPLLAGLDIKLGMVVKEIQRVNTTDCPEGVNIVFSTGNMTCFDKVIVTVPLGVLKAKSIKFSPELDSAKLEAIDRIGFGLVNKVCVFFNRVFWPEDMFYFGAVADVDEFGDAGLLRTWVSHRPYSKALMTVGVGANARTVETLSDAELLALVNKRLSSMFPGAFQPSDVDKIVRSGWSSDPFALGSYAFPAIGIDDKNDWYDLEKPEGQSVLFAGEATDREYRSTVHGAYLSGVRASNRIIHNNYKRLIDDSGDLTTGAIVGIVIGVVVGGISIGVCTYCVLRKKPQDQRATTPVEPFPPMAPKEAVSLSIQPHPQSEDEDQGTKKDTRYSSEYQDENSSA